MDRDFKGVWIPKEIWLNQDLGWSEKLLFVEIDSLAKNGQCFASNEYFGKFLGCHKKHISRLVSNLVETGLIRVELVYKPDSKQIDKRIIHVTTRNEIVPTPPQECSYPHHENVPTPIRKKVEDSSFINNTLINNTVNNTINNTNKEKKINKKSNSAELESEFEMLWKMYPKKQGKSKALQSYIKARKTKQIPYEMIENGLYRYNDYLKNQGTEEQFIMHGSTWFNQEKWLDEYICRTPQRKAKSAIELVQRMRGESFEFGRNGEIIDHYQGVLPH